MSEIMAKTIDETRPRLKLTGADGNAFAMLGLAHRAAKKAGWSREKWVEVHGEATAGGYSHLLQVLMRHFEVR